MTKRGPKPGLFTILTELIGQKFGPNNQLEVLAVNPPIACRQRTMKVHCAECAKDPEMFGDGIYNFNAVSVKNKSAICGCNSRYAFSEAQNVVRFTRLCKERGLEFLGFKGGHKGANSVLIVRCKEDGYEWTPQVTAFLKGSECKRCVRQRGTATGRESTARLVARFMATGGYPEGTEFIRHAEPGAWSLVCPKCSHNGEAFKSTLPQLSKGSRPCNCVASPYEPNAIYKLYVLRICSDSYDFTGYGISRMVDTRLRAHRRNLARMGFQITEMETFEMIGSDAIRVETLIGKTFPRFGQPVEGFVKEASYYWLYDDILAFVEDEEAKMYARDELNKAGVRGSNEITTQTEEPLLMCI